MQMIILTTEQAAAVRGKHGEYSALEPVKLTDGNYGLPTDVLEDPDLAEVHDQLMLLPVEDVLMAENTVKEEF